ncbi:MAG: ATP-binding protein [Proteobacteria bacterium]|jgi:signal transduction histidine kinase|nr:ATP-binding protein [Pseudomonadota bacterium]
MDTVEPSLKLALKDLVDQATFGEVAASFSRLFDLPVRIFDADGNLLVEADKQNALCRFLESRERTRQRCTVHRSRIKAFRPSPDARIENLPCFCGCDYAVTPIVQQAEVVGKIVIGPYLPAELERVPQAVFEIDPDIDVKRLREGLTAVRRLTSPTIQRLTETVASVVGSLVFVSRKSHVMNEMHIAAVRESFRELEEKNRRLEDMREAQREFERNKSNFLAMVSHELRTPLTSIIGYSDMLVEGIAGPLAPEQKQFVGTIKTKGDELLKLISSILDFTQMDSGRLTLRMADTDVAALVAEVAARAKEQADRRGIRLVTDVAQDLPTASLDPDKIATVLVHLLDNAIKFSPPGGVVKISARVAPAEEDDGAEDGVGFALMATVDMLEIRVEDFGIGIADGEQERVFAPFTQIDNSSTREHGGAGLGLAIVKHYVEAHGGRVLVRSRQDEGSAFTIRLPWVGG